MTKSQFANFQRATARCILLYLLHKKQQNISPDQEKKEYTENEKRSVERLRNFLNKTWGNLCRIYAADKDEWSVDPVFKGYLVCEIPGNSIRVPFHLADYFPTGEAIEALSRLASDIRVTPNGVICISGSSTFLEALKHMADIDYCEYAPFDKNENWHIEFIEALQVASRKQNHYLTCMRLIAFSGKQRTVYAYGNCENLHGTTLSHAKLDFITLFLENVIEATNIVLPVDTANSDDPILELSFAQQEAPIAEGTWIPQTLLEPISLGRYATWLTDEASEKLDSNPVKAAKRALALARIAGFWEEGSSVIDTLVTSNANMYSALNARSSLEPSLQELRQRNPQVGESFLNSLQTTLEKLSKIGIPSKASDDIIKGACQNVLDKVRLTVQEVQANVQRKTS
jgi:hypothetical protein